MNWFRNLSIRRKLTLIIISVSAVVLLVSLINVTHEVANGAPIGQETHPAEIIM
jgi:hypothetical protein